MRSQEVVINQEKQTLTISQNKAIDLAKIIRNENRLVKVNEELRLVIKKQDSIINNIANKNIESIETIKKQNIQIFNLSKDIQRYSDNQISYEEKRKSSSRLYLLFEFENIEYLNKINENSNLYSLGLIYLTKKISFGARLGYYKNNITYGASIGVSIF